MRRFVSFVGVTLLVAVACTTTPAGQPQSPGGQAVAGGRVVVGSFSDLKTMQPVISADSASSDRWNFIYQGLTRTSKDTGAVEPNLADKFELSSDGLTLTYTLRDGVVWSDGSPFTGDDYKLTAMAVARSKKTTRKDAFTNVTGFNDFKDGKAEDISGIQVTDNGKKVTIKFDKVYCGAIYRLGSAGTGGIIPKKVFGKYIDPKDPSKNLDDAPENMNPPLSIGPFVFKEYKPGDTWTAVRNDKYFRGAPLVDEVVVKVYADATAVKAALLTGEISFYNIEAKDYDEVKKSDLLKEYHFSGSNGYTYIGWNELSAKAPWLADKRVRQALWYGLNVDAIYQKILFGQGRRQFGDTPPTVGWAYDDSDLNKYPYDVNKAKQLLEQAGAKMGSDGVYRWTDGTPMKMRIETNQGNNARETILQFAQEQYRQIGIQIDPLLEAFPALTERSDPTNADLQGYILGWIGLGPSMDDYAIWHSSQRGPKQFNSVNYVNATVDRALSDNRDGPDCSQAARKKALHAIDKQLNEDAPYTFLYSADVLLFFNKTVQGADPGVWSTIWNVEKWWVKR